MSEDYLWDREGPVDPEVERLERLMGALAFAPRPEGPLVRALPPASEAVPTLDRARARRARVWVPLCGAAAAIILVLAGWRMWMAAPEGPAPNESIAPEPVTAPVPAEPIEGPMSRDPSAHTPAPAPPERPASELMSIDEATTSSGEPAPTAPGTTADRDTPSHAQMRAALRSARSRLESCVGPLTGVKPGTKVTIDLTIEGTGSVQRVRIRERDLSAAGRACLRSALEKVAFPPARIKQYHFRYRMAL